MGREQVKLGDKIVSNNSSEVYAIAEIGINHNGDLQIAKRLIDAAFAVGWDCVKFQKRTPELCVPEDQKRVLRDTPWGKITYLEYRYKVEFWEREYNYIDTYCKEKPIDWTASVWDEEALEFILKYDVPFVKIPSAKITDLTLVRKSAKSGLPVILSTGMSSLDEIDRAVSILEDVGQGNYILMHTNSAYPAPHEDINLRVMDSLRERYKCIVGYSGHEYDLEPTVIAVALGARIIERHITLDHNMWGSDHFASLEIHAMDMLLKRIKTAIEVLGDGEKKVTEKELGVRKKLRGV